MEDQFYITINSEQSKKYFVENSPGKFQVYLDQYLNFQDEYECALLDFMCTTKNFDGVMKDIYIYFNICTEQLVGDTRQSLVRSTTVKRGQFQMEKFYFPYYHNVRSMNTNLLELSIRDKTGNDVSFLTEITTCTFHFRRKKEMQN